MIVSSGTFLSVNFIQHNGSILLTFSYKFMVAYHIIKPAFDNENWHMQHILG